MRSSMKFKMSLFLVMLVIVMCVMPAIAKSSDAQNLEIGEPNSITIYTVPSGATVYLDNKLVNSKSNTTIRDIVGGIHTIKLILPGYVDYEKSVDVDSSGTTLVNVILDKKENTFNIVTDPKGADIYINNEYKGKTDQDFVLLEGQNYNILLNLEGYYTYNTTVNLREKTQMGTQHDLEGIHHDFVELPIFGILNLYSVPDMADVYIDGNLSGKTDMISKKITPGTHIIKVSQIGYDDKESSVQISPEKSTELRLTLSPSFGVLTIKTTPVSGTVYVDNKPYKLEKYSPGKHQIRIEADAFAPVSKEIDLNYLGQTLTIEMTPLAISEISKTEVIITDNLKYDPDQAKVVLNLSKQQLKNGEYILAWKSAQHAAVLANDVDEDSIPNWLDIQPKVKDTYTYILPFVILLVIIGVIWYDRRKCQVVPILEARVDDASEGKDVIGHVNLAVDKEYLSMVCTIYVDNMVIDTIVQTGENQVNLGLLTPGKHTMIANLSIQKKRYGLTTVTKTVEFEVK